jgi:hypothetical protein
LSSGPQNLNATNTQSQTQVQSKVVYVSTSPKTKSCSCVTEAKMEGPPRLRYPPLKAVASDSDWAKTNREVLANYVLTNSSYSSFVANHFFPGCDPVREGR